MIPSNRQRSAITLLLISSFLIFVQRPARACGPFFTDAIFVFQKHPDFPLERFARGQIGVPQTTYARSYLVAAYRNLAGEKLSDAEVTALSSLWEDRINLNWDERYDEAVKNWRDARAKVAGVGPSPEIQVYRNREKPHEYEAYLNCQEDAFDNAVATLSERSKKYGSDSVELREWVKAQDVVFSNCGGGGPDSAAGMTSNPVAVNGAQIPEATSSQDPFMRADRAYQIAAANFYAAKFDEAARQFDAIAHDTSSPWQDVAAYLAARATLRKGSLADKEEEGRPALAEAENKLKSILNDKRRTRLHHAATRLLNLTELRLHPEETIHELAETIVKRDNAGDFKQAVWDYTVLVDKFVSEDEVKIDAVPDTVKRDDITDWILTFQDTSEAAAKHATERWQKTKSMAWLFSALAKATPQTTDVALMTDAAARVDRSSSAFPSLVFHRARLLIASGRNAEARKLLDQTLSENAKALPPSAINVLTSQRMMVAVNLTEFLTAAQRTPAGFSDNSDGREIPEDEKEVEATTKEAKLFFDSDAANVFNKMMPVSVIDAAARNKTLASNLHRDVSQVAFMRAALIENAAIANSASVTLGAAHPELKEFLVSYQKADTPDARRFAAAYLALKFPGLRPYVTAGVGRGTEVGEMDSYRDNWWCAAPPATFGGYPGEAEEGGASKRPAVAPPEFLRRAQAEASREVAALRALGTGPNYLCETVISWANRSPADPRVPEALHLAVKSTRYGCTDKDTGRWSKAAFDLLHRKYPNTSWAKETKYWFKG